MLNHDNRRLDTTTAETQLKSATKLISSMFIDILWYDALVNFGSKTTTLAYTQQGCDVDVCSNIGHGYSEPFVYVSYNWLARTEYVW